MAEQQAADFKKHSSRQSCSAAVLSIALIAAVLVPSALAQAIPLPKPAPKARDATPAAAPNAVRPTASTTPAPLTAAATTPPNPVIPDPAQSRAGQPVHDLRRQAARAVAKVSSYLSSLQPLTGSFVQVGPDGSAADGRLLHPEAGQGALRLRPAEPDRDRSPTARRWWCATPSSPPRISIRCRRRRCASCCPTTSIC